MILPGLCLPNTPLLLPAVYASPSYAKKPDLGTLDCPRSRSLKGGTLCSPFLGLSSSGMPSPFDIAEFGASQVYLFRQFGNQNGVSQGPTPCGFFRQATLQSATWASGTATFYAVAGDPLPAAGASVTVAGMLPSGYNGTFTVATSNPGGASFTVSMSSPGGASTRGGVAGPGAWTNTPWSSNSFDPNADAWLNYPGPAPGIYPNRANYPYAGPLSGPTFTASLGAITAWEIVNAGTGYSPGGPETMSGGSGSGAVGWTDTVGGVDPNPVATEVILDGGSGYEVGDVLTVEDGDDNCTVQVTAIDSEVFSYPAWTLTSASFPHTGSGASYDPVWGVWTCPPAIAPDSYQLSALATWATSGVSYWALWGIENTSPWPDVMSIAQTLPFVAQSSSLPSGFSFAGSSVSISRISKPAFPYHP